MTRSWAGIPAGRRPGGLEPGAVTAPSSARRRTVTGIGEIEGSSMFAAADLLVLSCLQDVQSSSWSDANGVCDP